MSDPPPRPAQRPSDSLHSVKRQDIPVSVPPAIVKRLDDLLIGALKEDGYGKVARHEMIGALILSADTSPDVLHEQLRRYRLAKVREALPGAGGDVIEFPRKPAGRPRGS